MATLEETFLSDVHIGTFGSLSNQGTLTTRFAFHLRKVTGPILRPSDEQPTEDKDGDMVVIRRSADLENKVLYIEHAMSTTLPMVGLQVWRGALLMSDYLLSHPESLFGATVLELGAGTGLVSLVAATTANHVFCTDTGRDVLDLCQRNVSRNCDEVTGSLQVREIDWTQPFASSLPEFRWSDSDLQKLSTVDLILAADVIYSDRLTDVLLSCLALLHSKLSTKPPILLTLEKRINFTLEDLAPVAPARDYFMECMKKKYPTESRWLAVSFTAEPMCVEFEQHLKYERVKELVSKIN